MVLAATGVPPAVPFRLFRDTHALLLHETLPAVPRIGRRGIPDTRCEGRKSRVCYRRRQLAFRAFAGDRFSFEAAGGSFGERADAGARAVEGLEPKVIDAAEFKVGDSRLHRNFH